MNDYSGDDISIEEMPQGCVIFSVGKDGNKWMGYSIVVASKADALALIDSLKRMLDVQYQDAELEEKIENIKYAEDWK